MKKRFFTAVAALMCIATAAVVITALALSYGDCAPRAENSISYEDVFANTYDVTVTEKSDMLLYAPEGEPGYALLFYVGTAMSADNYDYVMRALASRGIAVAVSSNPFADLMYEETEKAFDLYPEAQYFIGGHSQGGGAAIRRAAENTDKTAGVILFSPMTINDSTLADKDIPAIYFEAENDKVLSEDLKNNAASRMNDECEFVLIEGANHMCYGETDFGLIDGENTRPLAEIQDEIILKTLTFIQKVADKKLTESNRLI